LDFYSPVFDSRLHTFDVKHRTVIEMFFKKIQAIEGESFGLANPRDETQAILHSQTYMKYDGEYSRLSLPWARRLDGYLNVMTFYFRASLVEQHDFYEPYTIIKLLETAGGLWTSLAALCSLVLVACVWCVGCFRESVVLGKEGTRRTGVRFSGKLPGPRESASPAGPV